MAGHMDEVVNLIERVRRGADRHGFLLSAALVPDPVMTMLKMYVTTYRTDGRALTLHEMQKRVEGTSNALLFGVLCIPVPNLADIHLILNGMVIPGRDFLAQLDALDNRGRLADPNRHSLPPGTLTLEHDDGDNTRRLCEGRNQEDS